MEGKSACWKLHTADMTVKHVPIQVFSPPTVMLEIPLVLCRAIATTKLAASWIPAIQCLVIHVSEHTNILKSNIGAFAR